MVHALTHRYEVIKDYHPIIRLRGGILGESLKPVLIKGDILIPMNQHKEDNRFKSTKQDYTALYEHTILSYPQFFKRID